MIYMKKVFIVVCACLLAACHNQQKEVSIPQEYIDNQTIEAPALEDWEFGAYGQIGYYSFEVDSTIKDFVYFDCDSIKQVVISYYSEPTQLKAIHLAIDDIIIAKGWRYPLESWHDFEEDLSANLGDGIAFRLGEIEIEID